MSSLVSQVENVSPPSGSVIRIQIVRMAVMRVETTVMSNPVILTNSSSAISLASVFLPVGSVMETMTVEMMMTVMNMRAALRWNVIKHNSLVTSINVSPCPTDVTMRRIAMMEVMRRDVLNSVKIINSTAIQMIIVLTSLWCVMVTQLMDVVMLMMRLIVHQGSIVDVSYQNFPAVMDHVFPLSLFVMALETVLKEVMKIIATVQEDAQVRREHVAQDLTSVSLPSSGVMEMWTVKMAVMRKDAASKRSVTIPH